MDEVRMEDDFFEMDCPQYVDFTVPQTMNDNADEWFNFDHENGIPIKFDEDMSEEETAQHPTRETITKDETTSDSAPETLSPSDQEMSEMSVDSLEDKPAAAVASADSSIPTDSAGEETKTRGSPEVPVPKRRGNIVTSFAHRDVDTSSANGHNQPSKPEPKKPSSRPRSMDVKTNPRMLRKSPRLQTRRSADPARLKHGSTSQATKRRSANAAMNRPRSASVDQPNIKRRKMANDQSVNNASQTETKKSCPKIKGRITLTLPTTPTLLKRNVVKTGLQIKSSEQLEMEKIAEGRQGLAEIRKKAAMSYKTLKESAPPVLSAHASILPTKAKEFKFETDARLKSHPMETRKDVENEKNFVGNLRKYVASSSKPQGYTKPKPFILSDNRKRTHEQSSAAEKKAYEFRSTALAVSQFHTKTPDRFHSKPASEQNKGPEPVSDRPKKSKLTHPMTPALESRNRHRPITVLSQAEIEEQQVAEMKNYRFKAQPVDPRVMSNISIGVKTSHHKEPTRPIGFNLETDRRLQEREAKKDHTEERYEFRARPLPVKILAGPVGIAEAKPLPLTDAKSPAFALKMRARVYEEKERAKEKEPEVCTSNIIKARPVLHVGVPFVPNVQHKTTEQIPFSFDEKIQESKARKEARKMEILEEEKRARQFRAQPMPDPDVCSGIPVKKVKPPTQKAPFSVAEKGAKQAEEWSKKMEEEIRECKRVASGFKAKPADILYKEPFVPDKSNKTMTDISNFTLNTEKRAEERKDFEQRKYKRQCEAEATRAQQEAGREEEIRREISRQRAEVVHRANPIRQYKTVAVLPSTKSLTVARSPKFSDRTRRSFLDRKEQLVYDS